MAVNSIAVSLSADIVTEAHQKQQQLIQLGKDREQINTDQRNILLWFLSSPEHYEALGYDTFWDFVCDPEIAAALWGSEVVTDATRNRLIRKVELQIAIPEIDVFQLLPKSISSTPAMALIENEIAGLPSFDSPDRPAAVEKAKETMTATAGRTWKENKNLLKVKARQIFHFNDKRKTIEDENGIALLKFDTLNPRAIRVINLILRGEVESVTIDEDSLTAWNNNVPERLAQVMTSNKNHLKMISELVHGNRRF